jgi:hypothetical protein
MASIKRQYVDEIHDEFGYWGTWEPDVEIALGDVGTVEDHVFVPRGSLHDYGIDFQPHADPRKADRDYQSKHGVDIKFQLSGESQTIPEVPPGKAGLAIKFSSEVAIVFAFKGGVENRMESEEEMRRHLIAKAQSKEFDIDYAVVTHVFTCDSLSAIVSQSKSAEYVVSAEADFKAGLVDLANASLGLTVASSRDLATKTLAQEGGTPMFRAIRLKRNFWDDVSVREFSLEASDQEVPDVFEDVTPTNIDRA